MEALEVPEAAATLQQHLLELYQQGGKIISDLAATGDYRLAIEPLIAEYESSSKAFTEKIGSANDNETLIKYLHEYKTSVTAISDRARRIEPSALSQRSHKRFVDNLATVQTELTNTITGLRAEDATLIETAEKKWRRLTEIAIQFASG